MRIKHIISIIILIVGLFYTVAPHSVHVSTGLGLGWEHSYHLVMGVILLLIGLIALFKLK